MAPPRVVSFVALACGHSRELDLTGGMPPETHCARCGQTVPTTAHLIGAEEARQRNVARQEQT